MRRWLWELIRAHYWPDPLGSVLFDLVIVVLVLFCVLSGIVLAGGRP